MSDLIEIKEEAYVSVLTKREASSLRCPQMLDSILRGHMPGHVYVDQREEPRTLLVHTSFNWFFVFTDGTQDFESIYSLTQAAMKDKETPLVIFSDHESLVPYLQDHHGMDFRAINRVTYAFITENIKTLEAMPADSHIKIVPVDPYNLKEVMGLAEGIEDFWGSGKNFLEKSFGYALYEKDQLASVCLANYVSDTINEVDVITGQEFRGKHYGAYVVARFMDHTLKEGKTPHWETVDVNKASCRLAEKLGYEKSDQYPMYVHFS